MKYIFWRGFYAFSNEICAWLHNKAFKFFMFIYMFLGPSSFSLEKLWRPPCLFHLTWSLEATFWLPGPSTCGAYVILLSPHMIRKWIKALDQQSEALWVPFREREKKKDKVRKMSFRKIFWKSQCLSSAGFQWWSLNKRDYRLQYGLG